MDLVASAFRVLEIDLRDFQQREIAFAVARAADLAFHRITGAQTEFADLGRRNINVVRPGQIVGFR